MDGNTLAMIKALGGSGSVEDLTTSGGAADAGKVLVVGNDGSISAESISGETVIDNTLSIEGAAADAKATGDALASVNESLQSKADVIPRTEDSTASVTLLAEWNHKYVYGSTLTDLTVTIPTAPTAYNAEIVIVVNPCGATAPVITLPNTVVLDGDSATADEYYEISISNELVAFARSVSLT